MGDEYFISFGSSVNDEFLRLVHGTDIDSASYIAESGLSWEELSKVEGAFAFFATIDPNIANQYAWLNPARGTPATVSFDVPVFTLQNFMESEPPVAIEYMEDKAYAFLPDSFPIMNLVMTNFSVQEVIDLTITFDE